MMIRYNRKEAKDFSEILKAFSEGKDLQYSEDNIEWKDVVCKDEIAILDVTKYSYRVKPKITYRAFRNKEECLEEIKKHNPFGWIKKGKIFSSIITLEDNHLSFATLGTMTYTNAFLSLSFLDGKPFGKEEKNESANN